MGDLKMKFMAFLFVAIFPSLVLAQNPGSALANFEKDHGSVDGIVDQVCADRQGISEGYKIRKLLESANGAAIDDKTARALYADLVDKADAKAATQVAAAEKKFDLKEKDIEAAVDKFTDDLDGRHPEVFLNKLASRLRALSKGHVHPDKAQAMSLARLVKLRMDAVFVKARREDAGYLDRVLENGKAEYKSVVKSGKAKTADSGVETTH